MEKCKLDACCRGAWHEHPICSVRRWLLMHYTRGRIVIRWRACVRDFLVRAGCVLLSRKCVRCRRDEMSFADPASLRAGKYDRYGVLERWAFEDGDEGRDVW